MKAKEVLNLLNITRTTLSDYVKKGKIGVLAQENGRFEYAQDDVLELLAGQPRVACAYYAYTDEALCDDAVAELRRCAEKNGYELESVYLDDHTMACDSRILYRLLYDISRYRVKLLLLYDEFNALAATDKELVEYLCAAYYCEVAYVIRSEKYGFI